MTKGHSVGTHAVFAARLQPSDKIQILQWNFNARETSLQSDSQAYKLLHEAAGGSVRH